MVKSHKKVVSLAILACLSVFALMAKKPYENNKRSKKECSGSSCHMKNDSKMDNSMNTTNRDKKENRKRDNRRSKDKNKKRKEKNNQNSM
jgi:hypothetical protein